MQQPPAVTEASPASAAETYPRFRWVIISQVILQQQLGALMFGSLGVLLPAMKADLGFGVIEAGYLGSARTIGNLLVFPVSFLLVRFSPVRLFNMFALVLAAALVISGTASRFEFVLAGMALYSFGMSFGQIPANIVRQQWIPPREMATVMGGALSLGTIFQSAGLALVPLILVAVGGWRSIFIGNGCILLAVAVVWFFTAHERVAASGERAHDHEQTLALAKIVLKRREFYLLGAAVLGGATTFTTNLLFLPSYFVHERGFSLQTAGSITALLPLGGLLVNLIAGYVSDRIGRRKPLIWPSGLLLPPLWFLLLTPLPPWALMVDAAVVGCFVFLPFPSLMTIPLEIPGLSQRARAVGQALQASISTAGILLGPIVASHIVALTGSYRSGLIPLLLLPTMFIWATLFLPETGTKRATAA